MRITALDCLHADAGHRNFDFLKVTTDAGLVGWSEYNESFGGKGVTAAIRHLAPAVVGKDPRAYEAVVALLYAIRAPNSASGRRASCSPRWSARTPGVLRGRAEQEVALAV